MGLSGNILEYLKISGTRVQVEAREIKLLLFETFSFNLFFTWASSRGACAPKNSYLTQCIIRVMSWGKKTISNKAILFYVSIIFHIIFSLHFFSLQKCSFQTKMQTRTLFPFPSDDIIFSFMAFFVACAWLVMPDMENVTIIMFFQKTDFL